MVKSSLGKQVKFGGLGWYKSPNKLESLQLLKSLIFLVKPRQVITSTTAPVWLFWESPEKTR